MVCFEWQHSQNKFGELINIRCGWGRLSSANGKNLSEIYSEVYIINTEFWKDIIGYEGSYQISNLGNIKSIGRNIKYSNGIVVPYREKLLNGFVSTSGYKAIDLYKNNKRKKFYIHRLVAETFIDNPLNKPEINHINENKLDNRVENLEWCTSSENNLAGTVIERANETRKMKKTAFKKVAMCDLNDNIIQIFDSIEIAVKETGINRKTIYNSCNNKFKSRKYKWKYIA